MGGEFVLNSFFASYRLYPEYPSIMVIIIILLLCLFQSYSNAQKLEDIRNAVINELSKSCLCQITADNIDQEQLACSDLHASLNYVTYQARLIGTLEKSSAFLTSLIEDWASSGPSIHVQGMLLGLGERCTSDISAGVCSVFGALNETRKCPSTNTGAIVGTVAVVLIIAAIVVATLIILRSRRGKVSLRNAEE